MTTNEGTIHLIKADDPSIVELNTATKGDMTFSDELTIDSHEMYEIAAGMLSDVAARKKRLKLRKDTVMDPLKTAVDAVKKLFSGPEGMLEIAETTIKRKMADWNNKVRIERETEERKMAVAQEEARAAAAKLLEQTEENFAEGKATVGDLEDAHAHVEIAEITTPLAQVKAVPKTSAGTGIKYVVTVTSLPDLLEFIAADLRKELPRFTNTIDIKIGQLNDFAKATAGETPIPGCTITKDTKIIAR